jgi:hypothetical protein
MSCVVQKDLFLVNGIYYFQFRDLVTRKLLTKITSGLRNGIPKRNEALKVRNLSLIDAARNIKLMPKQNLFYGN